MKRLLILLLWCVCSPAALAAGGRQLPWPVDLSKQSAPAVVVLFSLPNCAYCEKVRQQTLLYLETDSRYQGRVRVFEVDFQDRQRRFVWFDARQYNGLDLGQLLNVKFSPTVMVFDHQGGVVGKPLLGAGLPDFYGAYVDELIRSAWAASARY
ncbi:MAG TPA: thioredoxin fold domain-containing protein [Limnobacter sp.]|nr:thioredoxin fold domain-containing protein [Limnobacter sp.]